MKTLTAFDRVRRHLDNARRLFEWSGADLTFDDQAESDLHARQGLDEYDTAERLVKEHRPAVTYDTAFTGVLVELIGLERVRVWDESLNLHRTVDWARIDAPGSE